MGDTGLGDRLGEPEIQNNTLGPYVDRLPDSNSGADGVHKAVSLTCVHAVVKLVIACLAILTQIPWWGGFWK